MWLLSSQHVGAQVSSEKRSLAEVAHPTAASTARCPRLVQGLEQLFHPALVARLVSAWRSWPEPSAGARGHCWRRPGAQARVRRLARQIAALEAENAKLKGALHAEVTSMVSFNQLVAWMNANDYLMHA